VTAGGQAVNGCSMTAAATPFLLARLVTDQLQAVPVDTSLPGWQTQVAQSVETAFDVDLARVSHPRLPDPGASALARQLLTALTWALGAGLPEDEWSSIGSVITGQPVGPDEVSWVLDALGRYVVQDGDAGVAVYRIAHQALLDYLRIPYQGSVEQPFDPQALPVARELLERYQQLLDAGLSVTEPSYLRRYAYLHAATAGPESVDVLRHLAERDERLLPDVAATQLTIADAFHYWGRLGEAVAPTEEAVKLYRQLAAANPAFLPDLASALNNLGIHYSEVGRRGEAVAPTEEAVELRRQLAAANPAFLPELASALSNLGNRYSGVGRVADVDQAWQESVMRVPRAARPQLLCQRSAWAEPGTPAAAGWLVEALELAEGGNDWTRVAHNQARRHRAADSARWDAAWTAASRSGLPDWLTVDSTLLGLAGEWVETPSYEKERDHLASHPELLDPKADVAVAEAVLGLSAVEANRFLAIRRTACQHGVEDAYRPLLLEALAAEFAAADPTAQRELLDDRRADLLDPLVRQVLTQRAGDDSAARLALSLLQLADGYDHLLDEVFQSLIDPEQFGTLLDSVAHQGDVGVLSAVAAVAFAGAQTQPQLATAVFFTAAATAAGGSMDDARWLARKGVEADPGQRMPWVAKLAGIGGIHPQVLDLIPYLLTLAHPGTGSASPE
jgi:tetratricopeptide (TPR) repeat protein